MPSNPQLSFRCRQKFAAFSVKWVLFLSNLFLNDIVYERPLIHTSLNFPKRENRTSEAWRKKIVFDLWQILKNKTLWVKGRLLFFVYFEMTDWLRSHNQNTRWTLNLFYFLESFILAIPRYWHSQNIFLE